jgi:3-hydroxybutyryl-CoA dehydrogenase
MINKVGVIGAGMMGAEIALCFAEAGIDTVLCDISLEFAEKGKEKQNTILTKKVAKEKITEEVKSEILSNVVPTGDLKDVADCDLIIEAVVENLEIKASLYKSLDEICKRECVISSNTSSISITKLASFVSAERAGSFIGTHFNSPASIMKLVEVIPGILTKETVTQEVILLLSSLGKEPVQVKDVVGFGLNRLFHCFYAEACRLVEEGVCTIEDVDKICVYGLGHPIGIFRLLDNLGHDLNLAVDQIMFEGYGERFRPSPLLRRLVDANMLGRKSGKGFYDYSE